MRLTTMTDYAMRLLMYLGQNPDRLCTITEITENYGISKSHLMKITNRLSRAGWITTVRGKNGGMHLAHKPENIPLGAVIRDMENDMDLVECMGDNKSCTLIGNCVLPRIIAGALTQFMNHLDNHSLNDLITPATSNAKQPVKFIKPESIHNVQ